MKFPREQNPLSSPPTTSTTHEATTNPSLPKDYKKVIQSLIHRRNISLDVKIDLWKRFAEYEACVDEENHAAEEEEPVFTAISVGEIGPDIEMPVPWMERVTSDGSDNGGREYIEEKSDNGGREYIEEKSDNGGREYIEENSDSGGIEFIEENSDSGYGGNGRNSVDGVEQTEGEESIDAAPPMEGEESSNTAENTVEEEIATTTDTNRGQEKDGDDSKGNGIANINYNPIAILPISGQEDIISNNKHQEPEAANTTIAVTAATNHPFDHTTSLTPHPTTNATPPTPSPAPRPSTALAQCRLDIRNYISHLAERERVVAAREKWVMSRAEALWRNARVVAGMLRREGEGRGRKRVEGMNDGSEEGRVRKRVRRV